MDDKVKLIVIAAGGMLGSFVLFFLVFYFVFPPDAEPGEMAAQAQVAGQEAASSQMAQGGQATSRSRASAADAVMLYSGEMEQTIPANPKIEGYNWAKWGMDVDTVLAMLRKEIGERAVEGYAAIETYSPPDSAFTNVVALNPDEKRLKVEYRFYKDRLFHVEVYYSSYYREKVFNTFLFEMMRVFGKPYEIYPSVDEMGNIILHVKWDTEDSLIEMISKPNGFYSMFLRSQQIIYTLEEVRKSAERITY
ncbi:MAG: hypothetical protein JXQ83_07145 [Candidatus Glassbacteria bacterium]|nr:hypothetical protein [Candidatus Glassbacteria bacterium]